MPSAKEQVLPESLRRLKVVKRMGVESMFFELGKCDNSHVERILDSVLFLPTLYSWQDPLLIK